MSRNTIICTSKCKSGTYIRRYHIRKRSGKYTNKWCDNCQRAFMLEGFKCFCCGRTLRTNSKHRKMERI